MSRTNRKNQKKNRERHISVRSVRRDPPDLRKLSRAVIALALAEREAEAEVEAQDRAITQQRHSVESDTTDAPQLGGRS